MLKPNWMTNDVYAEFVKVRPMESCKLCGESEPKLLTIDHMQKQLVRLEKKDVHLK